MKKSEMRNGFCFVLFFSVVFAIFAQMAVNRYKPEKGIKVHKKQNSEPRSELDSLLDAIEQVESGGNAKAVGDGGNAIGAYQIWKIFVDDVNRIAKTQYSYEDRWDRNKSREMARIYLLHYGGSTKEMAMKYNGGPNGHKKKTTEKYWLKVQKELKKYNYSANIGPKL